MRTKKLLTAILLVLCAVLAAGTWFLYTNLRFTDYQADTYAESAAEISNPYIGWYEIHRYTLSDTASADLSTIRSMVYKPGLELLEINLQNYAASPLSDSALQALDGLLAAWRSTGRQLIVRFLYDWDGNAREREPGSLDQILTHMTQTAEVVNQYTDCVYILQGLFIGSWGEMHGSNYEGYEQMLTLIRHLDSVVSEDIFLSVRTPKQWRTLSGSPEPLTSGQAFAASLPSRLGLFNDGMLGSSTDLDTYWDPNDPDSIPLTGKLTRTEEIAFQNQLCNYVPNGGEVVIDNPYNDFEAASADLRSSHVSYLNRSYDKNVLDKWQASTCTEDSPYNGMNGLHYISAHLGYRYVIRDSDFSHEHPMKKNAVLTVTLENVGFSPCYRPFDVSLLLRHTDTQEIYQEPIQTDTRAWIPGITNQLEIPLDLHSYPAGSYELYLKVSDPLTGFTVSLANEAASQEEYGCPIAALNLRTLFDLSEQNPRPGARIGESYAPAVRTSLQTKEDSKASSLVLPLRQADI